jgi:hypothetical protein
MDSNGNPPITVNLPICRLHRSTHPILRIHRESSVSASAGFDGAQPSL